MRATHVVAHSVPYGGRKVLGQQHSNRPCTHVVVCPLQRYLDNGGYQDAAEPIKLDISKPTPAVVGTFAHFLNWYAAGRAGDPSNTRRGGRKVGFGTFS